MPGWFWIVLFKRLIADERVPRTRTLLLGARRPLDLIPDFIPLAGQLDDAIVVGFALRSILRVGEAPVREHWPGPESSLRFILQARSTPG